MSTNKAAWIKNKLEKPFVVDDAPMWEPGPDQILVKNHAVAINPIDWKVQDEEDEAQFISTYPFVLGIDLAGTVVSVGSSVTNFSPGDHIMSCSNSLITQSASCGAFQSYALVPPAMSARIPASLPFSTAAVMPLAISTAAAGLYQPKALNLRPFPSATPPPSNGKVLIVWGASASIGTATVQLARASGYEVAATASPRNHGLLRELGAKWVFDYNEQGVLGKMAEELKGTETAGVYDAISTEATQRLCAELLSKLQGRKFLLCVIPILKVEGLPEGVETGSIFATTIANDEVGPAVWGKYVPEALANGSLKCKPDALITGKGLEAIQAACQRNKEGVSAQKVVVELA